MSTNCDLFVAHLEALLAEDTDGSTRTELLAHATDCTRCATLLAAMRGGASTHADAAGAADPFVVRVLQQTSGSACARAQAELPDWVDASLAADESELVALHLQHCAACSALAAVLGTLRHELPALAEAEPGAAFTAAVVAATRRLRPHHAASRWQALWQQLVGRPRLAWEFATAACFVLMLLCTLPFSPFRPLPQQTFALIRVDAVGLLQSGAAQAGPPLRAAATRAWAASGARIEGAIAARRTFARLHTDTAWAAVRADLAEAGAGIRSRNLARLSHALHDLSADLRRLLAPSGTSPAEPQGGGSP